MRDAYMNNYSHILKKILSPYQYGFRKGFNAQHCLIALIETWKKSFDSGGAFGALMKDLSKAFDSYHMIY